MQRKIRKNKRKRRRAFGKLTGAICLTAFMVGKTYALPQDGNVVAGTASIIRPSHTEMLINQMTNKAIINWKSFDIARNELVRFNQPSSVAVALNRVIGKDPSEIFGQLIANGRIFLVNPNGILFGETAQIDVAGLLATTLDIKNEDFLNGKFDFLQNPEADFASVINRGRIEVDQNGFVMLVAPSVENEGLILAKLGKVVLASGTEYQFDFTGDGLITYSVSAEKGRALTDLDVVNKGVIKAEGGTVVLTAKAAKDVFSSVVNNEGIIEAKSLVERDGKIILEGGAVENSGTLEVSAAEPGAKPGYISVTGETVKNKGSILANGAENSDAGSIYLYSTKTTYLGASSVIEAKGVGENSNGGFVEVSSAKEVELGGMLDVSAESGQPGVVVVDPETVTISSDVYTGGGDYDVNATQSITVDPSIVISTRHTLSSIDNQETASSVGDSGNINFTAPDITIGAGAKLLTFATDGYSSGNINLYAAGDESVNLTIGEGAILKGKNINIYAQTSKDSSFGDDLEDIAYQVFLDFLEDEEGDMPFVQGGKEITETNAQIFVKSGANLEGENITISSEASSTAKVWLVLPVSTAAYSVTKATSQIDIQGNLKASQGINIFSKAKEELLSDAETRIRVNEERGNNNFYIAVAYGKGDLTSTVTIGDSAVVEGGFVDIKAQGDKKVSVVARSTPYKDGTMSGSAAIGTFSENIGVDIKGSVTSTTGKVNIESRLDMEKLKVKSGAASGTGFLTKYTDLHYHLTTRFFNVFLNRVAPQPISNSKMDNKFSFSLSLSYLDSSATVKTGVFSGASVSSAGELNIESFCIYPDPGIESGASGSVSNNKQAPKEYSMAGAISIVKVDDTVETHVYSGASLSSPERIYIHSDLDMSYGGSFDPYTGNWDSFKGVSNGTFHYVNESIEYVKSYVGPNNIAVSTSGGNTVGVAGMVSITHFSGASKAIVDDGVFLNQPLANPGKITVEAESDLFFLNAAALWAGELLSNSDKNAVGGSYTDLTWKQDTLAYLGASGNATDVWVLADSDDFLFNMGITGSRAEKFAINAGFAWVDLDKTTEAGILSGAELTVLDALGSETWIQAEDKSTVINIMGGVVLGESTGIGASAALTTVNRDTEAFIGGTLFTSSPVKVKAENSGLALGITIAGTKVSQDTAAFKGLKEDDPLDGVSLPNLFGEEKQVKSGLSVVFAGTTQVIEETTKAYANSLTLLPLTDAVPDFDLIAVRDTGVLSIGGTAAVTKSGGTGAGLNGAFMGNYVTVNTEAFMKDSKVKTDDLFIKAEEKGYTVAIGAGGAQAESAEGTSIAVAGSVTKNQKNVTLLAYVDNSTVETDEIEIWTEDTSDVASAAVDISEAQISAGAAIAFNTVNGTERAYVENSDITSNSTTRVESEADRSLITVSVSASSASSGYLAAAASASINESTVTNEAYIKGKKTKGITSTDKVIVKSTVSDSVVVIAGSASVDKSGSSLGVGASLGYNYMANTSRAFVEDTSFQVSDLIISSEMKNLIVDAGISGGYSRAGVGFNLAINKEENLVEAYLKNTQLDTVGSLGIKAYYEGDTHVYGGTIEGGTSLGVGGSGVVNVFSNKVWAYMENATVSTGGTNKVELYLENGTSESIWGLGIFAHAIEKNYTGIATAAFTNSGYFTLSGVASVNIFEDDTKAYIKDSKVISEKDVKVRSYHKAESSAGVGALAVNSNAAGVGLSAGAQVFKDRTQAYIEGSEVQASDVSVQASSVERPFITAVAGSILNTVSVAGSVGLVYSEELTSAFINESSITGGTVVVKAEDTFETRRGDIAGLIVGSLSATAGPAGVGGGVGVINVKNKTYAFVSGSSLNVPSLEVSANATRDIYYAVANVAGGEYLGLSGSVGVISIGTDTEAFIASSESGKNSNINAETVNVKSEDTTLLEGGVGNAAGSLGGSVGASVNVVSIHGYNAAFIGDDSEVASTWGVRVSAETERHLKVTTIGLGAGLGGVQGTVSVVNIGSAFDEDAAQATGDTSSGVEQSITDPFSFDTGFSEANDDRNTGLFGSSVAEDLSTTSTLKDQTLAAIGDGAWVKSDPGLIVEARNTTTLTSDLGGGAVGGLSIGGSVNIVRNFGNVEAYTGIGTYLEVKSGQAEFTAQHYFNGTLTTYAGSGGGVTLGAAVSYLYQSNQVISHVGDNSTLVGEFAPSLKLESAVNTTAKVHSIGTYGGITAVAGAVASKAVLEGKVKAYTGQGATLGTTDKKLQDVTIKASEEDQLDVYALPVNVGTVSLEAAVSEVDYMPMLAAYLGSENKLYLKGNLDITTHLLYDISPSADGVNIGLLTAGASVVKMDVSPELEAFLSERSETKAEGWVKVSSEIDADSKVSARATSTHGGALLGVEGSVTTISENATVKAYTGTGAQVEATKDITFSALVEDSAEAYTTGITVGGLLSLGLSHSEVCYEPLATTSVGDSAILKTSNGDLILEASVKGNVLANAIAGSGGVVSGDASLAETTISGTTKVNTGSSSKLSTPNTLIMKATRDITFNSVADSYQASIVGMSGASASNLVKDNKVRIQVGKSSNLEASGYELIAFNKLNKPYISGPNANEASGGVFEGAASESVTRLRNTNTGIYIGSGASLKLLGDYLSKNQLLAKAVNDFDLYDEAKLSSGGVIAVADAEAKTLAEDGIWAEVGLSENAEIQAMGNVVLAAATRAKVEANARSYTYGGASSASGSSKASVKATDKVYLSSGAKITASRSVSFLAGADDESNALIQTTAYTDIFNRAIVPIEGDPNAEAISERQAYVIVEDNAEIKTGLDINLKATEGRLHASGYGQATDLYREALQEIEEWFGDDEDASTKKIAGTSTISGTGTVEVNGYLETGIYRHQYVTFGQDFNPGFYVVEYEINNGTGTGSDLVPNAVVKRDDFYDVYDSNGNYVKSIAPSQISKGISWSLVTNTAIGVRTKNRIERLKELKTIYSGDPDTLQDIESELAVLQAELEDPAMKQTTHVIKLDTIFASSGDINIWADNLKGRGTLNAPGDVKIDIRNDSPLPLEVGTAAIPWEYGGHVRFNGLSVHENADIARINQDGSTPSFSITDGVNSPAPEINIISTYQKTAYATDSQGNTLYLYPPPLCIGYYATEGESSGNTYIENLGGTVNIKSSGSIIVTESISANTIKLDATGSFFFNNPDAVYHVLGAPESQFKPTADSAKSYTSGEGTYGDSYFQEKVCKRRVPLIIGECVEYAPRYPGYISYNDTLSTIDPYNGYTIAGNNIFINASIININGVIQSGIPDREITISEVSSQGIEVVTNSAYSQAYSFNEEPPKVFLTQDGEPVIAQGVRAEFKDGKIYLSPVDVQGGTVFLSGRIINTGNNQKKGWINVVDGYGKITVTNLTNYPVVIQGIDTGGVEGKVTIVDKMKDNYGGLHEKGEYYLVTEYVRKGNTIYVYSNKGKNTGKVELTSDYLINTLKGRLTEYEPLDGIFYYWTAGTTSGKKRVSVYKHTYEKFLGLFTIDEDDYRSDWLETEYTQELDKADLPEGEIVGKYSDYEDPYVIKHLIKTIDGKTYVDIDIEHDSSWLGLVTETTVTWTVTHYYTQNDYYFHYVKANYPIKIHFIGYDKGEVNIQSNAPVEIAKTIRNPEGVTSISASAISMKNLALIQGETINLNSGTFIGTQEAPIKISGAIVNGNAITPEVNVTATSDVNLESINSDLVVSSIVTGGDIKIVSDLDLTFKTYDLFDDTSLSGALVKGRDIYLESHYGAISAAGDEFINVDTDVEAGGRLTVLASSGEIKVRELTDDLNLYQIRTSGDVYIEVPFGNLVDDNPNEKKDDRTIAELMHIWESLGLTGNSAKVLADEQVKAYNRMMKNQYFSYWKNYRNLQVNPDGTYSYDPYEEVTFKLSDQKREAFRNAGWTDQMIADYENKMTQLYNEWGQKDFNPDFTYDVKTEDPDQYQLLTDNLWTERQLEHPLPSFLFKKNVTDTVYVNEEPNILGHDVYLFVGGSVGRDEADIVYNYSNPASVPQEEKDRVYLALAAAEIGDVRIDPEKKEIIIHQRDDIDLKATGKVTAIAGGPVYLGSDSSVTVHNLYSRDDQVRLKVYENILASAGILNVTAPQGLVLEAAYGGIGTAESPLSVYLNEGKPLTARAREDIYLFVPNGNLYVGYIYTPENLTLSVPNGIVRDYFGDVNVDINVGGATFVAAGLGDLGGPDNALNLDLSDGDLTFYVTGNANLTVDSEVNLKESAVKGAFYLDTYGDLNVAGDVFVGEAEFTSQGEITLSGQLLASTGHLFLSAKGDLSAKQALNAADWMRLEAKGNISLSGPVYGQTSLNISAGGAFESIAPLTTDKGPFVISAGGDISVSDSLFGSQGVTITGGGNSSFVHNTGDIFSYGDILVSGISDFYQAGSLTNHPSIISSQKVDIEVSGNIVLNGDLLAEDLNLRSSGGNITLTNRVEGYTGVNIESYGDLTSTWAIFTEGDLTIKSKKGSIFLWNVQGKKSTNIIAGTENSEGSADLTITENGLVASFGNVLIQASGDILNQGYLSSKGSLTIKSLHGNIELHDEVHGAPGEDAYTAKFKYINALNEAIGVLNDHLDDLENNRDQMVKKLQWINQNFKSWVDASSNSWRTYRDYFSAIENTPLFQDTVHFVFGNQFDEFIPPENIPLNPVLEIVSSVDLPSEIPTLDVSSPNIDVTSPPDHEVRITAPGFIISDATIGAGQDLFISGGVLDLAGTIGGENIYTTSAGKTTLEDGAILYASQDLQMDAGESFESGAYLLAGGAIKLSGESNILVRNFVFSAANVLEYATSLGLPDLFKTLAQGGENGVEIRSKGATEVEGMVLSPGNISFSSGSNLRVDGLILSASGVPQMVSKLLAEKGSVQPEDLDSLAFSVLEQSADVNAIEIESDGQVEITGFGTYAAGKVSVKGKSLDLAANIFGAEDKFELAHAFRQTFGSVLAYGSNVEIKAGSFLEEPLGLVLSLVGEVHLSTTKGNVEVSTVGAPRGKIFVTSAGGIFDRDYGTVPTDVDFYAPEVELVAISGIGAPNNLLDIRTSKLGAVTETGGLYLAIANDGDLHLGHIVAGSGDVHLELYGANLWVDDLVEARKGGVVLKVPQGFILGDGRVAAIKESTLVAGKYIGLPFRPLEVDIKNRLNIGIFGKDAHYGFSTYLKGTTGDQFLHFLNLTPGLTALNNVTKGGRPQDDFFFGTGIEIENTAGEVFRHFPGLQKPTISGFEKRMNEGLFELETNSPQSEQGEAVSLHKKFKKWVRKLTTFMRRTDV